MQHSISAVLAGAILLVGCDKKPETTAQSPSATGQQVASADWCAEHGVPESVCTRCDPKLIAEFKKKGDWCKEHNLPESQCIECNPELKEKFAAMAPQKGK